MIFLNKAELILINKTVLKRSSSHLIEVQYPQRLDLVIKQPQQVVFGCELYPNIWIKTPYIIQKIAKKHIFLNGNKRTAIIAGLTFLELNGHELDFTADEGEKIMLGVTNSPDTDLTPKGNDLTCGMVKETLL